MHFDRRLTWKNHIKAKRQQLTIKASKMTWLLGRNSQVSIENKILLYKAILKPVWTYGIQLWGTASNSNIEILQRFQSKMLRKIVNAPFYVTNVNIHNDLNIPFVKDVIRKHSIAYVNKLQSHTNTLGINLADNSSEIRRLKRKHVLDLQYL
ncbi:hypothetical protein KR200_001937 [Drosophila serrata]|nr:hypothetical protein KR200_001937 [Drosophila serrata]